MRDSEERSCLLPKRKPVCVSNNDVETFMLMAHLLSHQVTLRESSPRERMRKGVEVETKCCWMMGGNASGLVDTQK